MTEQDAQEWVLERFGSAGHAQLATLVELVIAESEHQNLIARSTFADMWTRHLVDSAQLIGMAGDYSGLWLDIGSGAGFPGLVVAALTDRPVHLVEPRKRRAQFLTKATEALGIASRVTVSASRVEEIVDVAAVISARAVAALPDLFANAAKCADIDTLWLLPKGQSAVEEVANAAPAWHGTFHVEQSITNPDSKIVVARGVARRCK